MTISAKIIADSVGAAGVRLTTLQLRYPRFIHAEFMTHRVFSRNASSSRAIPVKRLIAEVEQDPVYPSSWGLNQRGMQAGGVLSENAEQAARHTWDYARNTAIEAAESFYAQGLHKQIVNRILEPFAHINVVVSATEWDNFFALRMHPDAQPEIQELATRMHEAMEASTPQLLESGVWHLPYILDVEHMFLDTANLIKISVARCARVSYRAHDGAPSEPEKDLELYERLVGSTPMHATPAEHQAMPDELVFTTSRIRPVWSNPMLHGNLRGWCQLRKGLEHSGTIPA